MTGRERLLVGGGLALCAAGFAWLNGGVRVGVNLGLVRIDAAPLPVVVMVSFLLGMLTLFDSHYYPRNPDRYRLGRSR